MRILILIQAVFNVSLIIDNDYVLHPRPRSLISLFCFVSDLFEVFATVKTLNAQSDPGKDRLSLHDHEPRVRARGSKINVVLRGQCEHQQRCQQKQQPNPEAVQQSRQGNPTQQNARQGPL